MVLQRKKTAETCTLWSVGTVVVVLRYLNKPHIHMEGPTLLTKLHALTTKTKLSQLLCASRWVVYLQYSLTNSENFLQFKHIAEKQ